MADIIKDNRQTGRTTRMLMHARQLISEGKKVYVVMATQKDIDYVKSDFSFLPCYHSVSQLFDAETLTMRGQPKDSVCLVDHLVIELRYGHILSAYHQFDMDNVESLLSSSTDNAKPTHKSSGKLDPESEEWDRIAGDVAMSYCPVIYPCRHCFYPVISGYCCTSCGSAEPE